MGCALVGGRRGRRGCLRWSKCDALQTGLQLDALPCIISSAVNIKIDSSIDIIDTIGEVTDTATVMMHSVVITSTIPSNVAPSAVTALAVHQKTGN